MRCNKIHQWIAAILIALFCVTLSQADSDFVTVAEGYRADDYLTGAEDSFDAFCAVDSQTIAISGVQLDLKVLELGDPSQIPTVVDNLGQPTDGYCDYYVNRGVWISSSFIEKSPIDDSYWVGFTTQSNVEDRIYQVSSTGTWTHRATVPGSFDLEFCDGMLYFSANAGLGNQVIAMDYSGSTQTVVANIGGNSSGIAFATDGSGDLYHAPYSSYNLLRFSGEDIQDALEPGGVPCELGDATQLYSYPLGSGDTEVDADGNVLFNGNEYGGPALGYIRLWDEESPTTSTVIATGESGFWLQSLETVGDVQSGGGVIYTTAANYTTFEGGITKITKLLPGDANGDGKVDSSDLGLMANNWQTSAGWAGGNFNGDTIVDSSDLGLLANNWQDSLSLESAMMTVFPMVIVPEPSTVMLMIAMLAVGLASAGLRTARR